MITIYGSQEAARKAEGTWVPHNKQVNVIEEEAEKQQEKPLADKAELGEATKKVPLDPNIADQEVVLGSNLSEAEEKNLMGFLRSNKDVFAWSAKELFGISRGII